MMEKLAQPGEGWGVHAHTLSLHLPLPKLQCTYAPAERADTLILFHLYPYVLCGPVCPGPTLAGTREDGQTTE
jgi:hypothetical protein